MVDIDQVRLNMNSESIGALKYILALVMYGIALDLSIQDFKMVARNPKGIIAGVLGQFLMLPFLTFVVLYFIELKPSIALGMILVSACPGGNVSNFITSLAKGNVALSVGLTAIATLLAIVMTPFNLLFYGKLLHYTAPLITEIKINKLEMFESVVFMLGLPLVLGMFTRHYFYKFSILVGTWIKRFSLLFLIVFILGALVANWANFKVSISTIIGVVFLHNFIALFSGYLTAVLFKCSEEDKRCITIEVGIQNSGLALALVFQFFQGLGGMALISAWWGIWHVVSGLTVVKIWRTLDKRKEMKKAVV